MGHRITDKAMLVRLNIRQWTGRKLDRSASRELADVKGAQADVARVNKDLVDRDAVKRVSAVATEARDYHYAHTLPWRDDGARLLPVALFDDYRRAMRRIEDRFTVAAQELIDAYDSLRADAPYRLGALFNAADYPTATEIHDRFAFHVAVDPVPDAGDFRVSLADEELQGIRAEIENRNEKAIADANRDLWDRLHGCVSALAERLANGTPDGKPKIFRDSLIQNARDLCGILPALNVTGDPELARLADEVRDKLTEIGRAHV